MPACTVHFTIVKQTHFPRLHAFLVSYAALLCDKYEEFVYQKFAIWKALHQKCNWFYLEKTRVLDLTYLFENKVFAQTNTGQRTVRIRSDCFFSILFTY